MSTASDVEQIVEYEPVTLRRGRPVELVRWRHTEDGWTFDLVRGTYRSRNLDTVIATVDGQDTKFPRDQWHVCAA